MDLGESTARIPVPRDEQDGNPPMLRLAVISSPRSGNTWLREMIAALYGLEQIPVHFPEDIPWENLPRRCVIQIHWHPRQDFLESLTRTGVRVVAVARHPFDVLLSFLNYTYYVHQEGICSRPDGCNECSIVGVSPRSEAFLNYATGEHGQILLSHTAAWWERPEVMRTRYGDLVTDPEAALGELIRQIGESPRRSIAEVVEANSLQRMKPNREAWQYHYWQGRPGLWRSMIPSAEANYLGEAHRRVFETLDYSWASDPDLEPLQADLNWLQLQLNSTREHLGLERSKHRQVIAEAKSLTDRLRTSDQFVREQADVLARISAELATTRTQLHEETKYRETCEQAYLELHPLFLTARNDLDHARDALNQSQDELHAARGELDAIRGELDASRGELDATRGDLEATSQRLDVTRQQLAPMNELGPRALKWSLRLKRLYRKIKQLFSPPSAPASGTTPALFRRRQDAKNRVTR